MYRITEFLLYFIHSFKSFADLFKQYDVMYYFEYTFPCHI